MNGDEIIELKFEGNNISPSIVKPHEITELVNSFERALLYTIKKNHPEIDTTQLLFSFEKIKDESLDIQFFPKLVQSIVLSSFVLISDSIKNANFETLDSKTINELNTFVKFSNKYQCIGSFTYNGNRLSSLSGNTEIAIPKNKEATEETVIFGEITGAGGLKPNVHLRINDEYNIIISTDKKTSKILANKLYEKVKLAGIAKYDVDTTQITHFKISEILDYTPGNTYQAITELRAITSGYWDQFNTNEDINNELLRD